MPPSSIGRVIKHRAPTSALRQLTDLVRDVGVLTKVIKRPAPNGALRPDHSGGIGVARAEARHIASSAKRRIKTQYRSCSHSCPQESRHKAPSAKRCIKTLNDGALKAVARPVIKYRTPNGALRLRIGTHYSILITESHKAPSAKRCIKTLGTLSWVWSFCGGHKAPSAKRCIKTAFSAFSFIRDSFLRHKAPSAKRCIKTG